MAEAKNKIEIKQKLKMDELKKRFREAEGENDLLQKKLHRAHKSIKRLRLERSILLERIDEGFDNNGSDSDANSDFLLHHDKPSTHHHHHYNHHHRHKHHKQSEKSSGATSTTVIKPPKKKKDPNAPKGPGNVFFLFCRQERDKIKEENPEESIGDVTKLLGIKWKGLTKEEKQVYYDTFKREMDEYEEAMKTYKSNLPLDEDNTQRSQSVDPAEEVATAESLMSSPVSTNTDIMIMQQHQHNYTSDEQLYDHRFQSSFIADNHHHHHDQHHHHHQLYEPQSTNFMAINPESHLLAQQQHYRPRHHHHSGIQRQQEQQQQQHQQQHQQQQQQQQPAFVMDNSFENPVPSAPYDRL